MKMKGIVSTALFMFSLSLSGQAQDKSRIIFKVPPEFEQIDASMKANTVRANLRDNPEQLPESIKLESALNELLTASGTLALPEDDITELYSTNRMTDEGARVYAEVATRRVQLQLTAICEAAETMDTEDADVDTLMEMKAKAQVIEEEDAQAYWRGVISRLSPLGQDSFTSIVAVLGIRGDIDISHSHVNWVGFGAEQPTSALDMVKQGCTRRKTRLATPKNYDPKMRILKLETQ